MFLQLIYFLLIRQKKDVLLISQKTILLNLQHLKEKILK